MFLNFYVYANNSKISRARAHAQGLAYDSPYSENMNMVPSKFFTQANWPSPSQCLEQFKGYQQAGTDPTAQTECRKIYRLLSYALPFGV